MIPNGYQVFKIDYQRQADLLPMRGDPKATLAEAEASIKIAKDSLGEVTYVILPVYTNKLPLKE
jgi:DNA-dependent RNA polymerase auxiliary subunit epsilon